MRASLRQWVRPQRVLSTQQQLASFRESEPPYSSQAKHSSSPKIQEREREIAIFRPNLFLLLLLVSLFFVCCRRVFIGPHLCLYFVHTLSWLPYWLTYHHMLAYGNHDGEGYSYKLFFSSRLSGITLRNVSTRVPKWFLFKNTRLFWSFFIYAFITKKKSLLCSFSKYHNILLSKYFYFLFDLLIFFAKFHASLSNQRS